MYLEQLSRQIGELTQPSHPHYFKGQLFLFSTVSYLSSACLTSIPPLNGALFITLSFAISQVAAPFFAAQLEEYRQVTLVPLAGQCMQLTASFLSAKLICSLAGCALSLRQCAQAGMAFLITLYAIKFATRKFRQGLQTAHS